MSIRAMYPYLRVGQADRALAFYRDAFSATERFRLVEVLA